VTHNREEGGTSGGRYPEAAFERGLLAALAEVDASALSPARPATSELDALLGELAAAEVDARDLAARIARKANPILMDASEQVTARIDALNAAIDDARARCYNPVADAWREGKTLMNALDEAVDKRDARLRLRGILRRTIRRMYLLVVPAGKRKLAFVQVRFRECKEVRNYAILYTPPHGQGAKRIPGRWEEISVRAVPGVDTIDLADRAAAERLAAHLSTLDPSTLDGADRKAGGCE
jgi:hypothetical protein